MLRHQRRRQERLRIATGNNSCAGTAKGEFEKGAWKYVPAGTCTSTTVTLPDGNTRNGSLQPIKS